MERLFQGPSDVGVSGSETFMTSQGELVIEDSPSEWLFSRQEIENSPSRKDGIDLRKETYLRRQYSTFIQDLGMRLKLPQECIATAITVCHRFYHVQSHAKNDRYLIGTACIHIAAKAEECLRNLNSVIMKSWDILRKKDPHFQERMKQKDFFQQQRELVCVAERMVLINLRFEVKVHHPYNLIVAAIKKIGIAQEALAQVAWNFVNDGLRTSIFLQFKHNDIAAGVIFLASKFLKVKLPFHWWKELKVDPRQLQEISEQLIELYYQSRESAGSGRNEESSSGANNCQMPCKYGTSSKVPTYGKKSQDDLLPTAWNGSETCQVTDADEGQQPPGKDATSSKDAFCSSHKKENLIAKNCPAVDSAYIGKPDAAADQSKDNKKKVSDDSICSVLQLNKDVEERQGSKHPCDGPGDEPRSRIPYNLTQDSCASVDNTCRGKTVAFVDQHKPKRIQHSDKSPLSKLQVDEVDLRILKERQANKLDDDRPGDETKDGIGSINHEQFSSIQINYVNKEKIKDALKRKSSHPKGRNSKPSISETEARDEEVLIELELERGVEAAVTERKAKQKGEKSESCCRSKEECIGKEGNKLRIKRSEEDVISNNAMMLERIECSFDQAEVPDQSQSMVPANGYHHEKEEGELSDCPVEEFMSSQMSPNIQSLSNQTLNRKSSIKFHDYYDHNHCRNRDASYRFDDQHGSRDRSNRCHDQHRSRDRSRSRERSDRCHDEHGSKLSKYHHSYYSPIHQHRRDHNRDKKRYADRDWEEYSYKQSQHGNRR